MRLGVLDVGSNTIHLQVVDAHRGAQPVPATSHKTELHLTDYLDAGGAITIEGIQALTLIIKAAMTEAAKFQTEEILTFATSAIRDATNGERVINHINENCGIELSVLSGEEEARFTFLGILLVAGLVGQVVICWSSTSEVVHLNLLPVAMRNRHLRYRFHLVQVG